MAYGRGVLFLELRSAPACDHPVTTEKGRHLWTLPQVEQWHLPAAGSGGSEQERPRGELGQVPGPALWRGPLRTENISSVLAHATCNYVPAVPMACKQSFGAGKGQG